MALWVVRGGRGGSYAQWCLAEGRAAAAWNSVPTLAHAQSRDDVVALVAPTMPNESTAKVGNLASQLWGLRSIEPGDTVILPLSSSGTLAVGVCTVGYEHLDEHAPARHSVRVHWRADEVPRAVLGQDLLNSLGSLLTVFQLSRHNAEARFAEVLRTGVDPEATADDPGETPSESVTTASGTLLDPEPVPTTESIRDRVRTHIRTHFREHELTRLVAAVLTVRGFHCDISPPGPDQGVDILAGTGPLGLDSPTLIVEVKSGGGAIGAPVVRGLQGAMLSHRADQGLLVAWGGITREARAEIRKDRLTMRVWDADDLLDQVLDVYEELDETIRAEMPLKRAWVLVENES
ncbi:restriction endonuclease [Aeromicrobium tamlense]|uniref:Restriction system protein n=2 Tax=Aeromicrobium tamlense TaxID=375541 RepID=A0ABX2SLS5_9ACTN|nr:restriction endonuclease [Aeromicrobium tamlense]NYI38753.1 restriction system protein [Aeromicrobium tamlense]